jgi:hypothetical protein
MLFCVHDMGGRRHADRSQCHERRSHIMDATSGAILLHGPLTMGTTLLCVQALNHNHVHAMDDMHLPPPCPVQLLLDAMDEDANLPSLTTRRVRRNK